MWSLSLREFNHEIHKPHERGREDGLVGGWRLNADAQRGWFARSLKEPRERKRKEGCGACPRGNRDWSEAGQDKESSLPPLNFRYLGHRQVQLPDQS